MAVYASSPSHLPPMQHEGVLLANAGFAVELLCIAATASDDLHQRYAPGFEIRRFRVRTRSMFHTLVGHSTRHRALAAIQYVLSYLEYVTKAFLYALRSRADVYEAHDLPPLLPIVLAAKLRRRPAVYRAHELWSETHTHVRFGRLWRLLDRLLVPLCDQVVTPEENRSRIYHEEFHAKRVPLTVRNCSPYREPIHSTRLHDELRRRGVCASTIVLYQGLMESGRCIEEIAEASRYLTDGITLVLIGHGFGKWANPASVLAGYDRIVTLPRVDYDELASFTASADIGILLYRNDCRNNYYCAPNKVFEYMMMGLPVVAPNYPGMLTLIEGEGVGLCADPERPTEIARVVNRLAADPQMRLAMRARGLRASAERYNWETESRPLLQLHRTLAASALGRE